MSNIPKIETLSQLEIKKFQEKKMQETLHYVNTNSPFYKKLFKTHNIDVSKIKTLEDLSSIPVTTKDDLQRYNADFLCVDKGKIIDYLTTSGTLGEPVVFAETANDLERLAYNELISFQCANGTPDDIYQLIVTLDRRFMAGMAYYDGIKKLGTGVVRVGPGNVGLQFDTINRIKPNALVTVPSFLLKMIEYANANHIDYQNTSIQKAICIGENIRTADFELNTLGKRIKDLWDIKLYSACKRGGNGGSNHHEYWS